MKKTGSLLLCAFLTLAPLAGCAPDAPGTSAPDVTSGADADFAPEDDEMFTDRDCSAAYQESEAVRIELSGSSAKASSDCVKISGSTITITEDAVHILSGTLDDGTVIVDAPDTAKLQIVLDNVSIKSSASAPLYIKEADKVFVTLVGENTLENGGTFTAAGKNKIDAAVFSKQDLTFNGSGSLTVSSPAGHGISCKDDLVFTGGTYAVRAASHALDANDSVRIRDAAFTLDAGKDGIHAENNDGGGKGFVYIAGGSLRIECGGDGVSAGAYMQIAGGFINILAGGGHENGAKAASSPFGAFGGTQDRFGPRPGSGTAEDTSGASTKGLKAGGDLLIEGGSFVLDTAGDGIHSDASVTIRGGTFEIAAGDDGVHADDTLTVAGGTIRISTSYEGFEALHVGILGGDIRLTATDDGLNAAGGANSLGTIVISGGTIYINASGDGIDANGTLEITGGHTTVAGPTQGDTATLDFDVSGVITGGTFIGTGSAFMAQTFSSSSQGVIAVLLESQAAGTGIVLLDRDGNEILSCEPELPFQAVILSSPDIKSGEAYTLIVGSQSGEFTAN